MAKPTYYEFIRRVLYRDAAANKPPGYLTERILAFIRRLSKNGKE